MGARRLARSTAASERQEYAGGQVTQGSPPWVPSLASGEKYMGHHEFGVWRTSAGTTTTSRFTTGLGIMPRTLQLSLTYDF